MIKAASKKYRFVVLFVLWTLGWTIAMQASSKKQDGNHENGSVDYAAANREILQFEAIINRVITSTFSSSPFAVVHAAKGAYLEGYGIIFNFTINIHRAVISTPFGQFRARQEITPELKKRRIEELKEKLILTLQNNGEILRQLRKKDTVTIIAYFEDRNFPDEPSENKTILLSAQKRDLDELGHKNNSLKEFKQRMKIIEY